MFWIHSMGTFEKKAILVRRYARLFSLLNICEKIVEYEFRELRKYEASDPSSERAFPWHDRLQNSQ